MFINILTGLLLMMSAFFFWAGYESHMTNSYLAGVFLLIEAFLIRGIDWKHGFDGRYDTAWMFKEDSTSIFKDLK